MCCIEYERFLIIARLAKPLFVKLPDFQFIVTIEEFTEFKAELKLAVRIVVELID